MHPVFVFFGGGPGGLFKCTGLSIGPLKPAFSRVVTITQSKCLTKPVGQSFKLDVGL